MTTEHLGSSLSLNLSPLKGVFEYVAEITVSYLCIWWIKEVPNEG